MSKATKSLLVAFREVYVSSWPLCYPKDLLKTFIAICCFSSRCVWLKTLICPLVFFLFPEALACAESSINTDPNPSLVKGLQWRFGKAFLIYSCLCAILKSKKLSKPLFLLIHLVENLTWSNVRLFIVFISLCRNIYVFCFKNINVFGHEVLLWTHVEVTCCVHCVNLSKYQKTSEFWNTAGHKTFR